MAMIRLTPFAGMQPKIGTRLLPNEGAQSAMNVKLQSGELRPLRGATPANTGDSDYVAGKGYGGNGGYGAHGQDGYVVIYY